MAFVKCKITIVNGASSTNKHGLRALSQVSLFE